MLPPGDEVKICQVLSIAPPSRHAALREIVAANLCGRWRDGTPLALSADAPDPNVDQANFDYDRQLPLPLWSPYPPVQSARRADRATDSEQQPAPCSARRALWTTPMIRNAASAGRSGTGTGPARQLHRGQPRRPVRGDVLRLAEPWPAGSAHHRLQRSDHGHQRSRHELVRLAAQIRQHDPAAADCRSSSRTRGGAYTFLPSLSAIRYLGSLMM